MRPLRVKTLDGTQKMILVIIIVDILVLLGSCDPLLGG